MTRESLHPKQWILTSRTTFLSRWCGTQNDNTYSRWMSLSEKFHYQYRYSSCDESSPENISYCDKPWPIFHKDLIREIIGAVGKKSEKSSAKKYFWEWCGTMQCWINNKIHHATDVDCIEKKCWYDGDFPGRQMREVLCIPFRTKEWDPHSINREKEYHCGYKNKKKFYHEKKNYISSIL